MGPGYDSTGTGVKSVSELTDLYIKEKTVSRINQNLLLKIIL